MEQKLEKIAIHYRVLPGIFKDLRRDLQNEMAGFLIGCVFSLGGSLGLYVSDFSPATEYSSTHTGVRIDPRSFLDLDKMLMTYKRTYICVGWYHSHPFNGTFVQPSGIDKDTIYRSFHKFYHVSLIIDPISHCKDIWRVENGQIVSAKNIVSLVTVIGKE